MLLVPTTAYAADTGGRGEATALRGTIADLAVDSGTYRVGTDQAAVGDNRPALTVLGAQDLVSAGVLAQDAIADDAGSAQACAGVAGDGATLVEVGDSGCLQPGDALRLHLATLDLSSLVDAELVTGSGELGGLLGLLLPDTRAAVVDALDLAIGDVAAQLGESELTLDAGLIQAACRVDGAAAPSGSSTLVDAAIHLTAPDGAAVELVDLDASPSGPLSAALPDLTSSVTDALTQALDQRLDALGPVLGGVLKGELVSFTLEQLRPALDDLEGVGVLSVLLDDQTLTADTLDVTALQVSALQALATYGGPAVLDLDLADVGCERFQRSPEGGDGGGGGGDDPTEDDPTGQGPNEPMPPVEPGPEVGPNEEQPGQPNSPVTDGLGRTPPSHAAATPATGTSGNDVPTAVEAGVAGDAAGAGLSALALSALFVLAGVAAGARRARSA
jgi:hypothetical protein